MQDLQTLAGTETINGRTRYKTAAAKEYPPSMCRAIARSAVEAIYEHHLCEDATFDSRDPGDDLKAFYTAYDHYDLEQPSDFGHDCMLFNTN